jgi:outer membrane protein TolC
VSIGHVGELRPAARHEHDIHVGERIDSHHLQLTVATGRFLFALLLVVASASATRADERPVTLRQAIAEALDQSPLLRQPDDGRTVAGIREMQAAAQFGFKLTPTFQAGSDPQGLSTRSIGVSITRRMPFGTTFQVAADSLALGQGAGEFRDAGYSIGISQPLLRGWTAVASAPLHQARRQSQSAERTYGEARQRLVVSVADAYFAAVRTRRLVDAADRALQRAIQLKRSSDARTKVGLATELDVLRADVLASQSEAALVFQREAHESAMDELKRLLGRSVDSDISLADTDVADTPVADSVELLVRTAMANRLDVREARDRIADARRQQTVARWQLLPPVNLEARYTRRGLASGGGYAFEHLYNGWRLGVSTTYSFDRSDDLAAVAIADVSVRAAERDAADLERLATDEVRRAYRTWTRTSTTIEIQSKAVALAERQLRLAEIRYERGVADNFDVIDAENALFQAQSALIAAQADRALASLSLRRVAGMLDPGHFER